MACETCHVSDTWHVRHAMCVTYGIRLAMCQGCAKGSGRSVRWREKKGKERKEKKEKGKEMKERKKERKKEKREREEGGRWVIPQFMDVLMVRTCRIKN